MLASLTMVCVAQYFWPNIYTADFFSVDNKMRYIDLYSSAYCIQLSCKILAFALVLICFRALEYLSISPRLHQISATFSHSLKNIAVRNVTYSVVSVMVFGDGVCCMVICLMVCAMQAFSVFFLFCLMGFAESFMLVSSSLVFLLLQIMMLVYKCNAERTHFSRP